MKRTPAPARGARLVTTRLARAPGMDLSHDVLVAVTMGIALALLGMTTWLSALGR